MCTFFFFKNLRKTSTTDSVLPKKRTESTVFYEFFFLSLLLEFLQRIYFQVRSSNVRTSIRRYVNVSEIAHSSCITKILSIRDTRLQILFFVLHGLYSDCTKTRNSVMLHLHYLPSHTIMIITILIHLYFQISTSFQTFSHFQHRFLQWERDRVKIARKHHWLNK